MNATQRSVSFKQVDSLNPDSNFMQGAIWLFWFSDEETEAEIK